MTQREAVPANETESYRKVRPTASIVAVEAASDWTVENAKKDCPTEALLHPKN
ncbi:MAG: hypothetical protein WBV71_19850 [Roseobacter sp.]